MSDTNQSPADQLVLSDHAHKQAQGVSPAAEMTLSSEQLHVGTEWMRTGQLRLRREIITETRTVEVTVRREILVVDGTDVAITNTDPDSDPANKGALTGTSYVVVGTSAHGQPRDPWTATPTPLVIVLREEVPDIALRTVGYERVTATLTQARTDTVVTAELRHEELTVHTTTGLTIAE